MRLNQKNPNSTLGGIKTWEDVAILVILAGAVVLKLLLLLTSQSAIDGDEAVVGIMAKHILEGKAAPMVFYGQNFGGGALIEALIALPFFASFEISSPALKAAGLIVFMALLVMVYIFVKKRFGIRPALISISFLALSPTFVEWALKTRGGHILSLFWGMAICHVLFERVLPLASQQSVVPHARPVRSYRNAVFSLGLLCGLNIWILHTNVVLVLLVLVFWLGSTWRYQFFKGVSAMALGIALGLVPLALHAIQTEQPLFDVLLRPRDGMLAPSPINAWRNLAALVEWLGPSVFTPRLDGNIALYHDGHIPFYSKLLFVSVLGATVWLMITAGKAVLALRLKSLAATDQSRVFVAAFIASYLAAFTLIDPEANQPRYLLPLTPFWIIALALSFEQMFLQRRRLMHYTGYVVLAIFLGIGGLVHVQWMFRPPSFYFAGNVYEYLAQEKVVQLIRFLRDRGIRYAYIPDHLMEWKTIFESREQIIAARLDRSHRYKPYVDAINQAVINEGKPYAVVLIRTQEAYSRWVMENVGQLIEQISRGTNIRSQSFGEYILVYYDFPGPIFAPLTAPESGAHEGK